MKKFEDYLKEAHAKQYRGTDDLMSDDYNNWLGTLDVEDIVSVAEIWGLLMFNAGKIEVNKEMVDIEKAERDEIAREDIQHDVNEEKKKDFLEQEGYASYKDYQESEGLI